MHDTSPDAPERPREAQALAALVATTALTPAGPHAALTGDASPAATQATIAAADQGGVVIDGKRYVLADASESRQTSDGGVVAIGGKRYLSLEALATALGKSTRTLQRWHATRTGPPRVEIGKLKLYD